MIETVAASVVSGRVDIHPSNSVLVVRNIGGTIGRAG